MSHCFSSRRNDNPLGLNCKASAKSSNYHQPKVGSQHLGGNFPQQIQECMQNKPAAKYPTVNISHRTPPSCISRRIRSVLVHHCHPTFEQALLTKDSVLPVNSNCPTFCMPLTTERCPSQVTDNPGRSADALFGKSKYERVGDTNEAMADNGRWEMAALENRRPCS